MRYRPNKAFEFAPALAGPPPGGFSAPLQTRRSARRWAREQTYNSGERS